MVVALSQVTYTDSLTSCCVLWNRQSKTNSSSILFNHKTTIFLNLHSTPHLSSSFSYPFFTCSYLLTWTKISRFVRKISVVCVFYLVVHAYLPQNFRTCANIACGLWFSTFLYLLTCPRNPKFQDSCKKSV